MVCGLDEAATKPVIFSGTEVERGSRGSVVEGVRSPGVTRRAKFYGWRSLPIEACSGLWLLESLSMPLILDRTV